MSPLDEAIGLVKAAGYRVSKPKAKAKPNRKTKDRVGPTIECRFSDGVVTRMSVCCSPTDLNWTRGERLAQAAWKSRWRTQHRIYTPYPVAEPVPPPIIAMHFEQDGVVLAQRNRGNESTT
jgi:hypothetical protein